MHKIGKTFIVSGPSGVGKSTVLHALFQGRDDLYFSVSATTRAPARVSRTAWTITSFRRTPSAT